MSLGPLAVVDVDLGGGRVRASLVPVALQVASRARGDLEDSSQPEREHHPHGSIHRAEQRTTERMRRFAKGDDDRPAESDDRDSPPPEPRAEKETSDNRRRNHRWSVSRGEA